LCTTAGASDTSTTGCVLSDRRLTICFFCGLVTEDILYAMRTLGFEEYIPPLMAYLERYRALEQSRRNEKQAPGTSEGTDGEDSESDGGGIDDSAKDDTS
jgi:hypothetical protein